jgi:hypothetical protein
MLLPSKPDVDWFGVRGFEATDPTARLLSALTAIHRGCERQPRLRRLDLAGADAASAAKLRRTFGPAA